MWKKKIVHKSIYKIYTYKGSTYNRFRIVAHIDLIIYKIQIYTYTGGGGNFTYDTSCGWSQDYYSTILL